MAQARVWTAGLVVVGDEILSGRTRDANIAQVASWLEVQGIRLAEVRVVPDVVERIAAAVGDLRAAYDYLFTTGGIGPTHDDITVDGVAAALGVPVVVHPKAQAILEAYYAGRGGMNEGRLRMARVPEGAELIENRMSGAPGIAVENIRMMAGVPAICAQMLDALTGTLEGGAPLLSETLGGWIQESEVARDGAGCQRPFIGVLDSVSDGDEGLRRILSVVDDGDVSRPSESVLLEEDILAKVIAFLRSRNHGRGALHVT
jgi:molybdenum cofactor synthesis domain-containing protein